MSGFSPNRREEQERIKQEHLREEMEKQAEKKRKKNKVGAPCRESIMSHCGLDSGLEYLLGELCSF